MDLLSQTKYLIKKTGLKPDKFLGQNFCVDASVIQKMIEASGINNQDTVLEVGPGFGFLTQELLKVAKQVMAVEMDIKLAALLKKMEAVNRNLTVINDDILKIQNPKPELGDGRAVAYPKSYKIVANLPYSITSAFLRRFLTSEHKPESMTLLVQKEVAERICAKPKNMSLLAVSVQLYGQPEIVKIISKKSFWPEPKVDSAIIKISDIHHFPYREITEKFFWQIVKSGFSSKRKQLKNNLANGLHLPSNVISDILTRTQINPLARAQELSLEEWRQLSRQMKNILQTNHKTTQTFTDLSPT